MPASVVADPQRPEPTLVCYVEGNMGSKSGRQQINARFLKRDKWWVAWTDDVPGALSQGKTLEEARTNLKDAIRLMLEPVPPEQMPGPSGHLVEETIIL